MSAVQPIREAQMSKLIQVGKTDGDSFPSRRQLVQLLPK
jgi:hypothetical protein